MQESEPLNPDKADMAEALQRLKPARPSLNAREVWYRAGLEAGRRRVVAWRAFSAVALALAISLAMLRLPSAATTQRVVHLPNETAPAVSDALPHRLSNEPPASAEYRRLLEAVEQYGLSALPPGPAGSDQDPPPPRQQSGVDAGYRFSPGGGYPMNERG